MSTTNGDATKLFASDNVMRFWTDSASRFSRANKVLVRGFTAAARMQVELGQELIQSQASAFKQITPREKPEAILKSQIAHQAEETEHLFEGIRKISDEIRHSFTEATRTLIATEAPAPAESVAAAARKPGFTGARKSAGSVETDQSS
jgi:hypothetical protein